MCSKKFIYSRKFAIEFSAAVSTLREALLSGKFVGKIMECDYIFLYHSRVLLEMDRLMYSALGED